MGRRIFLVGLFLLFVQRPSFAADLSERWEVGGQLGGLLTDNSADYEPHMLSGGRVGYYFDENWAAEAGLLVGPVDTKGGVESDDPTVFIPMLDAIYHFNPEDFNVGIDNMIPFLAAGAGAMAFDGDTPARNDGRFAMEAGGGLKWFLTDNLLTRFDGRWVLNTEGGAELHNATLTGGLSWVFDGPDRGTARQRMERPPIERPRAMPEAAATLEREGRVDVDLQVNFDFDKSDIKPQYEPRLREFAQFMNEHPGTTAEIEGHTDAIGTDEYNERLSMRRASSVSRWLTQEGDIDSGRLDAHGYGESRPIADNDSAQGRAQNRRVIGAVRR